MKNVLFVFLALALFGCAQVAWKEHRINQKPDRSCLTRSIKSYSIWFWDCYKNEHIVVRQLANDTILSKAIMEKSACGELTRFERRMKKHPERFECTRTNLEWQPVVVE